MTDRPSPATVARSAMSAVEAGERETWLSLFSEQARVEDPVGHVPVLVGRDALAGFWDAGIANLASVEFDVGRDWETSDEAMLIATVTIETPTGAGASYDGTFNYRIDDLGKIASLRAFWDLPTVGAALSA